MRTQNAKIKAQREQNRLKAQRRREKKKELEKLKEQNLVYKKLSLSLDEDDRSITDSQKGKLIIFLNKKENKRKLCQSNNSCGNSQEKGSRENSRKQSCFHS